MPRIIVTTDSPEPSERVPEQPERSTVLFDELVQSVHLSTGHAAAQLVERLAWAISDAEDAERARTDRPRAGDGTHEQRRPSNGRPGRGARERQPLAA
jgi:hypothetical protein